MKTTQKLLAGQLCACLIAGTSLCAETITWNSGDSGNWSTGSNWTDGIAPGAADEAVIAGGSSDLTVTYDSAAAGALAALQLEQAANGFSNTLLVSKTGSAATPSLLLDGDLTLGGDSELGKAILQLGTNTYLQLGATGNSTLSIGQNGVLLASANTTSPTINGNVVLNEGGLITLNSASNADTRTIVLGNFTANGGTIERVAGSARQGILQLKGETNVLNNVTFNGAPDIYLNSTGAQSLSTNTDIGSLFFRSASGVKTLSGTGTIGSIVIGGYNSATDLTFKLGSDLNTTTGFADGGWGGSAGATLGLDTNGYNFNASGGLSFVAGNAPSATWNIGNSGSAASTISATAITFHSASTYTVGGPLTLEARTGAINFNGATVTVGSTATLRSATAFNLTTANEANVTYQSGATLHHTGTGSSNLGNRSGINYRYTGTSGNLVSSGVLASLQVGDGTSASTLVRNSSSLSGITGDILIHRNATYVSGGWATTLANTASLTGNGKYTAINNTGSITWLSGATGGLSAGSTAGEVGELSFSAAGTVSGLPTINLATTSVSVFDIESTSSYDVINLGAFNIVFNGTLDLNFLGGYTPQLGDTFALFTQSAELNNVGESITGTMSGNFSQITSNLSGYAFEFNTATGLLTVVPEPATTAVVAALLALGATALVRRKRLARHQTPTVKQ